MRPARLTVGVVSAGRVGSVIGAALARAGHTVVAASAISKASVDRAERLLPGVPLLPPDDVARLADLVVLAVPDDVLPDLVAGLVTTKALRVGQIVVHTSGAHGIGVLAPTLEVGVLPLALHPVMTFTGRPEDLERMTACSIGVTALADDEAAWSVGEALSIEMGAEPVRVTEQSRKLYHAGLAHGANHLVTVVSDCLDLLRKAGIADAERVVAPLLSAALDNVLRQGDRALTGPVVRGDLSTISTHLEVLTEQMPQVTDCYLALADRTAHRASAAGIISADTASQIDALFNDFTKRRDTP